MNRQQYPHLTDEQYRDNKNFLRKLHIANGDLDEDTFDSEAMEARYTEPEEEIDQEQHEFEQSVEADKRY